MSRTPTFYGTTNVAVTSFGRKGTSEGEIYKAWGICQNSEGNIIVADRRNNRIQIFDEHGNFMLTFGRKGNEPGEFDLPVGITTDCMNRIIVADKRNHRIQIFSPSGDYIMQFGSNGGEPSQFNYPWDVATNLCNEIVVSDTENRRIQLFTSEGRFLRQYIFERKGNADGPCNNGRPRGVCFTKDGNVIVSDFRCSRIILIDKYFTRILRVFHHGGFCDSLLNRPSGIKTDRNGRIYVADAKNYRILVYSPEFENISSIYYDNVVSFKRRPCNQVITNQGTIVVLFECLEKDESCDVFYISIYPLSIGN